MHPSPSFCLSLSHTHTFRILWNWKNIHEISLHPLYSVSSYICHQLTFKLIINISVTRIFSSFYIFYMCVCVVETVSQSPQQSKDNQKNISTTTIKRIFYSARQKFAHCIRIFGHMTLRIYSLNATKQPNQ